MVKKNLLLAMVFSVFTLKSQTLTNLLFESKLTLVNPVSYPNFNKNIFYCLGTSYKKTDNLVTKSSTSRLMNIKENSICVFSNSASYKLNISNFLEANQINIIDPPVNVLGEEGLK